MKLIRREKHFCLFFKNSNLLFEWGNGLEEVNLLLIKAKSNYKLVLSRQNNFSIPNSGIQLLRIKIHKNYNMGVVQNIIWFKIKLFMMG